MWSLTSPPHEGECGYYLYNFQWKRSTFPPMEGECGPSLPLRTRVNVVNKYLTSNGSGPRFPPREGECGPSLPLRTRVNVVNNYITSDGSGPYSL